MEPVADGNLPGVRDSTNYVGQTRPETRTGDEHFNWIDIIDDTAYVAYVNGFSIWDLGCNLEQANCPVRLTTREIFRDQWASSDFAGGEVYLLTHTIDAFKASNGKRYAAINGIEGGIGLSVWDVTNASAPRQVYQDTHRDGYFAKLAEINGRVYAFYGSLEGGGAVHIYDIANADDGGSACVERTNDNDVNCPGVWRGSVGTFSSTDSVDVIQKNGRTFLAHAANSTTQTFELLEITNPSTSSASLRWSPSSIGGRARGLDLFEMSGDLYLGINIDDELRIYDVDSCLLTGSSCPNVNSPLWSDEAVEGFHERVFVTFTENSSSAFLYVGNTTYCHRGTRKESLYDISSLTTNPNQIYEVTEGVVQGGETYVDPHHNGLVDYWGHYYARNTHGLNGVSPRTVQIYDEYILRTARLVFDKHKFLPDADGGDPSVNVVSPGTFYFTQPTVVTAAASNCSTGSWNWSNDGGCDGQILTQAPNLSTYRITCDYPCANPPCAPWDVTVDAQTCGVEDSTTVTFEDGRAYIDDINLPPSTPPGEYPVCSVLQIGATVGGEPTSRSYLWELLDENGQPVEDPDTGGPLQATSPSWILDTTGLSAEPPGPEILLDDFETGDFSLWSGFAGGAGLFTAPMIDSPQRKRLAGPPIVGEGTDYQVRLTLSNSVVGQPFQAVSQETFRLLPLGELGAPSIQAVELANGFWRFTETGANATQWRWEFYLQGQLQDAINWPGQQIIEYTFPQAGTWTVRVYNGQCDVQGTSFDETTVVVETLEPPATIDMFQSLSCGGNPCIGGVCVCQPGDTAELLVRLEDGSAAPDSLEFDWTCGASEGFQVEQTLNNPTSNGDGTYSVSHQYNSSCSGNDHFPQVRARTNGVPSDTVSASPGIRVFD